MSDEGVAALSERRYPRAVLRTGRKVGRTLYLQLGPEPSDSDPLIGLMDTRTLAAALVDAINAAWELTDYFGHELAIDPGDTQAEWVLDLLRPIWAGDWVPEWPSDD